MREPVPVYPKLRFGRVAAVILVFAALHPSDALFASNFECLSGFGNVGFADAQGDELHGAGYTINGGVFCAGDNTRFAMRNLVGFAEFHSSEENTDIGAQYWLAEVNLYAALVQRAHFYGTVGIGGYYASMHPAPSGDNEHSLNGGYNAGLSVAFPIEDGPGVASN